MANRRTEKSTGPVPAPAARGRADPACAGRDALARRDPRRRARLARGHHPRGAHVAGPAARHHLRHAARRQGHEAGAGGARAQQAYIRGEVAHAVNLKFAPDIRFLADETFDEADRIESRCSSSEKVRQDSRAQVTRMARRKKGKAVHGWLVLDKPAGMTSTQAVGAVRRAVRCAEGRARRHARPAGDRRAADRARRGDQDRALRRRRRQGLPLHGALGRGDRHRRRRGPRRREPRCRPEQRAIEGSAAAVSSARSCRRRRPSPPSRSTATAPTIWRAPARSWSWRRGRCRSTSLTLTAMPDSDTAVFEAACGKGTYVRALARDMGRQLGCLGHVIELRRTRVAGLSAKPMPSPWQSLQAAAEAGRRRAGSAAAAGRGGLAGLAVLDVGQKRCRAPAARPGRADPRPRRADLSRGPTYATCKGQLIAVGADREGRAASDARVQLSAAE